MCTQCTLYSSSVLIFVVFICIMFIYRNVLLLFLTNLFYRYTKNKAHKCRNTRSNIFFNFQLEFLFWVKTLFLSCWLTFQSPRPRETPESLDMWPAGWSGGPAPPPSWSGGLAPPPSSQCDSKDGAVVRPRSPSGNCAPCASLRGKTLIFFSQSDFTVRQ